MLSGLKAEGATMYRSKSYDEELSERLQNRKYASGFLLTLMKGEDGLDLEEALKVTIERMGIKEFSNLSKIAAPNVVRMIKGRVQPTIATLDRYLAPFGLQVRVILEKKVA